MKIRVPVISALIICFALAEAKAQMPGNSFGRWGSMGRYSDSYYWQEYKRRKEEGGNVGPFQRQDNGFGIMMVSATLKHEIIRTDFKTNEVVSKEGSMDLKANAFWFSGATFFPVAKVGNKAAAAITWMATGSLFGFKPDPVPNGTGGYSQYSVDVMQIGMPVGFEYKSGCDAVLNKSLKSCFSFGAGVNPILTSALIGVETGSTTVSARPYLKAEFGFFAGLCFKLRGVYTLGKLNYVNIENSPTLIGAGTLGSLQIRDNTPGTLALSLVIVPLSYDWEDSKIY